MLPKQEIGTPGPDHWYGLIDGVYAIGLTILALEIPSYLKALANLWQRGDAYQIMSIYLFVIDIATYVAVFFILYEMWSFHRAIVCIGKMGGRNQTILNVLTLGLTTFVPAGISFYLDHQIDLITGLQINNHEIMRAIADTYSIHNLGNGSFMFVYALIFGLLHQLASKSRLIRDKEELVFIKRECKKRSTLITVLTIAYILLTRGLEIPCNSLILAILYVLFAYKEESKKIKPVQGTR